MIVIRQLVKLMSSFWLRLNFKTRLISLLTVLISLLMSSLTFWSLTTIQKDSLVTDTHFCRDLSLLFASNILSLVEQGNKKELVSFIEKSYLTTASVKYIQLFKVDGNLEFALPLYTNEIHSSFRVDQNILQIETHNFLFSTPVVNHSTIFYDQITDITVPLIKNGKSLGTLHLGINTNFTVSSSFRLIQYVSIAIFVSLWLMVIIGVTFNALTINESIEELLNGVKNIASGNFNQKIHSFFGGDLGRLILGFNEMAERLNLYERKNVEQLTSEKTKLETLVSTIADGAVLLDTDLHLLFANQVAINIFNWFNKDIVGTTIFTHLPTHVNEALLPILNNMVKSSFVYNYTSRAQEVCIDLNHNCMKTFRLLLTAVLDQNREVLTGVAITIQDITNETQLNEAKSQFISNVSHELRTPLCNISSFLETLLEYNDKLSVQQKLQFLGIANNETKRLTRLVDDILDLSKLEPKYNYKLKAINLKELIYDTINACQLTAISQDISIVVEFAKCDHIIFANESSILQVLSNLFGNALKFNHNGSIVVIRVYPLLSMNFHHYCQFQSNIVRIEIIDQGIGIEKNYQKNIFDRFMRIENNIHIFEGTGLGLSIVKNIIEKHNSQIFVYSEIGVGTSFWFDLLISG